MRTREEQIQSLWNSLTTDHYPCAHDETLARNHILEAERRAEQRVRAEINLRTVAAMARGYEEMFRVLTNIVSTSGTSAEWYRAKAMEAWSWVAPVYALSPTANIAPPGSCQWVSREGSFAKILQAQSAIDAAREVG